MNLYVRSWHIVAMLITLAMPPAGAATTATANVFIENGELNYVGAISEEANRQAFALFDSEQKKPGILSIRSKGGPTRAGMELGRWVHSNKLSVKVMEYCFSSCANYVFTAASRKVVSNFAVIGYHGGLSSSTFALDDEQEAMLSALPADQRQLVRTKLEESLVKALAPQAEAERIFFSLIGVQQRITTIGQAPDNVRDGNDKSIGWTYSTADFAKLGVHQIRVINPPWRPAFVNSDTPITVLNID